MVEPPASIALVGDDPLALEGLAQRLAAELGESAVRIAASDAVDWDATEVVVYLPSRSPEELELDSDTPALWLVENGARARAAIAAGARGVLSRAASARRLRRAVEALSSGLFVIDEELADDVFRFREVRDAPPAEEITPRELEVLEQLSLGRSNREIAERLNVSLHTAKFHVNSLMGKLGARSRTEVVAIAARAGLVTF